jgi:DNA-binding response OmpR family regulator
MQILISNTGDSLDDTLQRLGNEHELAIDKVNCRSALPEVRRRCPDVLVIDAGNDDLEAQRTLLDIRAFHAELPVVVVGVSQHASTAAAYLTAGADDYIRKPADLEELTARIGAVYRRANRPRHSGGITHAGPVVIDDRCKRVTVFEEEVALSPKEYQLLQLCASEPGKVFSHEEITECLWPQRDDGEGVDIKQYVHLLRSKLGRVRGGRDLIENVKGFGYRLLVQSAGDAAAELGADDRPIVVGEN